jgi:transglutaminase-like putative cysteine protease
MTPQTNLPSPAIVKWSSSLLLPWLLLSVPALATPLEVRDRIDAPGPHLAGLAADAVHVWLADPIEGRVLVMERGSEDVVATLIAPGPRPTGLAHDGTHLWVADALRRAAFRVDPATGEVVHRVDLPGERPEGLAWDGAHLWVVDAMTRTLYRVSATDGTTVASFPAPGRWPGDPAFLDGYLWLPEREHDEILQIHPETGWIVNVISAPGPAPVGVAPGPEGLIVADLQERALFELERLVDHVQGLAEPRSLVFEYRVDVDPLGPSPLDSFDLHVPLAADRPGQELDDDPVFTPEPQEVLAGSSQRYAHWRLEGLQAGEARAFSVRVEATLRRVDHLIVPERVKPLSVAPPELRAAYLADGEKYGLGASVIQDTVRRVVGSEERPYFIARRLYQHLITRLEYRLDGGWNAAPVVLERGDGSCSEYTFAYIALCRAAGVPARYVGGVVVRGDDASYDEVFHRWAEIYLPGVGWLPVDVNRGDRPDPRGQALGFGHLPNTQIVTTVDPGPVDPFLDWTYNGNHRFRYKGRARLEVRSVGILRPAD